MGFGEVYLENSFGTKLTSLESAARGGVVAAADNEGILPEKASDDFTSVSLINQPGEFTWPITLLTYIYVRQDLGFIQSPQEQSLLKAFFQALFDDSFVQQCADAYGFYKVDGHALNISLAAIDSLIVDSAATPFSFEEKTSVVVGAGDFTISAKRQSAIEVDIDVLTNANEMLVIQVSELGLLLQQTMMEVSKLEAPSPTGNTSTALILSIVSLLLSAVALILIYLEANSKKQVSAAQINGSAESA